MVRIRWCAGLTRACARRTVEPEGAARSAKFIDQYSGLATVMPTRVLLPNIRLCSRARFPRQAVNQSIRNCILYCPEDLEYAHNCYEEYQNFAVSAQHSEVALRQLQSFSDRDAKAAEGSAMQVQTDGGEDLAETKNEE